MQELLTPAEAAKLLKVPLSTLKHWRYTGEGPVWLRIGRLPRYDPRDLERYRDAQRVEAARGA